MQMGNFLKSLGLVLLGSAIAFADGISVEALSLGGAVTRDRHLSEINQILLGGRGGYMDIGTYYTPSSEQLPLDSKFGEHQGFAFKQRLAGFAAGEIAPGKYMGGLFWFDRSGWDGEDFMLFPKYNDFSLLRSVTTWGVTYTDVKSNYGLAAGMQHQNVEHVGFVYETENDSLLCSWAYLRYGKASIMGNFNGADWSSVSLSLDLEHRDVYEGNKSVRYQGFKNYLPNIRAAYYNGGDEDNRLRLTWNQDLYNQVIYGEIVYDILPDMDFHAAALRYYPDPSRLVAFEATCIRRGVRSGFKDLLWGGAIDLIFVRLAYNSAYDYDHFFGAKGTFLVEFKLSLASLEGMLFGRGAPVATPMETNILKERNKDKAPESSGIPLPGSSSVKTLDAKGIRYESQGGR